VLAGSDSKTIDDFLDDPARFRRPRILPSVSPTAVIVDFLVERGFGST
jgi:hypothetical protein